MSAGWPAFRLGVGILFGVSLLVSFVVTRPAPTPEPAATGSPDRLRTAGPSVPLTPPVRPEGSVRRRFAWMLAGSALSWTLMVTYESVLPIAVVRQGELSARQWGVCFALGPLLMLVAQLRLHELVRTAPILVRLGCGLGVMASSFLLLLAPFSLALLLVLIAVFVVGDMLWGPAGEEIVVRIAPEGQVGSYVGLGTSTIWVGSAVAPVIGLPLQARYGQGSLAALAVVLAGVATGCYAIALVPYSAMTDRKFHH